MVCWEKRPICVSLNLSCPIWSLSRYLNWSPYCYWARDQDAPGLMQLSFTIKIKDNYCQFSLAANFQVFFLIKESPIELLRVADSQACSLLLASIYILPKQFSSNGWRMTFSSKTTYNSGWFKYLNSNHLYLKSNHLKFTKLTMKFACYSYFTFPSGISLKESILASGAIVRCPKKEPVRIHLVQPLA